MMTLLQVHLYNADGFLGPRMNSESLRHKNYKTFNVICPENSSLGSVGSVPLDWLYGVYPFPVSVSAFILDSDLTATGDRLSRGPQPHSGRSTLGRCLFVLQTQIQANKQDGIISWRAYFQRHFLFLYWILVTSFEFNSHFRILVTKSSVRFLSYVFALFFFYFT